MLPPTTRPSSSVADLEPHEMTEEAVALARRIGPEHDTEKCARAISDPSEAKTKEHVRRSA